MTKENIIVCLYTDEDGRQLVAGMDIDSGRHWSEVFADCAKVIMENNGRVLDLREVSEK